MEDKEIIIEGVDVAGCVQLVEEPSYPCGLGGECKGWENCYYKQLKRLEQENKELKAENERLQKLTCFNCGEETLSPSGAEIYDKILVYKQTLQEIKDIVKECIKCEYCGSCKYLEDCNKDLDAAAFGVCKMILDLITKAEEE